MKGSRLAAVAIGLLIGLCGPIPDTVRADVFAVRCDHVFTNNGPDASDLHIIYCPKEAGNTLLDVVSSSPQFGPPTYQALPENCVEVDFDSGNVPNGGMALVKTTLTLQNRNYCIIKSAVWTDANHNPLPGPPPIGPGGFVVDPPAPGGNGGNGGLNGGGMGGQEGDGGPGFFLHPVTLVNDADKPLVLNELKLLASTTYYQSLEDDVPWDRIAPIDFGVPSVTIAAHSSLTYLFNTMGSYTGGHIYLKVTSTDDPMIMYGDHPVPAPVPEPASLALLGMGIPCLVGLGLRTRRRA
jgi:hypothetical protein